MATGSRSAFALPHEPARILIVGDEVNPHGLPAGELTQPADLLAAFTDPLNGIEFDTASDGVRLVLTDDLPQATAALAVPQGDPGAYHVLVYFAHRIPNGPSGPAEQTAFVAAVEEFLETGRGLLAFHHGIYRTAGKEAMLALIGGEATGAVPYDTITGQNVIDVGGGLLGVGVTWDGSLAYEDAANGVPAGPYSYFANVPDERYPNLTLFSSPGTNYIQFASNYDGGTHVLGWLHQRPNWNASVFAYQPGEYEPNALDLSGNNWRIIVNAVDYFMTHVGPSDAPEIGVGRHSNLEVWPNPMRDVVKVRRARVETDGRAISTAASRLLVFDSQGRRVTAVAGTNGAWSWDGRDAGGRSTPAGVYFLRTEDSRDATRLVRLR